MLICMNRKAIKVNIFTYHSEFYFIIFKFKEVTMLNSQGCQRLATKRRGEKTSYCQWRLFDYFSLVSPSYRHLVSGDP